MRFCATARSDTHAFIHIETTASPAFRTKLQPTTAATPNNKTTPKNGIILDMKKTAKTERRGVPHGKGEAAGWLITSHLATGA